MSSRKKDPLQPYPNLQWTRELGAEDYFDRADALRDRFWRLAAIAAVMVVASPLLAIWVVARARQPNPVRVLADGRVFSGELGYSTQVADEVVFTQMRDTVEVLLTRTEKGGVMALEDFVGPGVPELMEQWFAASKKMVSGYSQNYSVTSYRVLVASPTWVVLGVRGLLSSRTLNGYQPSELFFVAGFSPGKKTDRNALGWRLTRLLPDPDGQLYFNQELARQRAERLGLEQK